MPRPPSFQKVFPILALLAGVLALTLGAALNGLVAISMDGKIRAVRLKAIVPEVVRHILVGISTEKA